MPRLKSCKGPGCTVRKPREELLGNGHIFCSVECGTRLAIQRQEKAREQARKRQELKWKRDAARSKQEFKAQRKGRKNSGPEYGAERAVHAYILVRDYYKPCIVHGLNCPNAAGGWHAGHFQGVGRKPELRFNPLNIHKQCAISNTGNQNRARYRNSTDELYEQGLAARIGREAVERLKGPHPPKQYREADLLRIARWARRKTKHYRKLRGLD